MTVRAGSRNPRNRENEMKKREREREKEREQGVERGTRSKVKKRERSRAKTKLWTRNQDFDDVGRGVLLVLCCDGLTFTLFNVMNSSRGSCRARLAVGAVLTVLFYSPYSVSLTHSLSLSSSLPLSYSLNKRALRGPFSRYNPKRQKSSNTGDFKRQSC